MKRRTFNIGLIASSIGFATGTGARADDYRPLLQLARHKDGIGSHEHLLVDRLEHSFNYDLDKMRDFASRPACILISHHGSWDEIPNGWDGIALGYSTWPLYVGPEVGITSLTSEQLGSVLAGRIVDWEELGGRRHPITVITNRGLKFLGLRAALYENRILATRPAPRIHLQATGYSDILRKAHATEGVLVVGLRRIMPDGLAPITIDGQAPSLTDFGKYPLRLQTNILIRQDNERAREVLCDYLRAIVHEKQIDATAVQSV